MGNGEKWMWLYLLQQFIPSSAELADSTSQSDWRPQEVKLYAMSSGKPLTANANGMTCLLARCQAMTFASPLRTFIKAIECAAVFYAVAVVASCTGEAKT